MRRKVLALLLLSCPTIAQPQTCEGFAGMQFHVTSTVSAGLSVLPLGQTPGDIGLCAQNSAASDQGVTMFYRTSRRILKANASHALEQSVSLVRATQGLLRCLAANQNIGPFDLPIGSACIDGPPWCSSEVGLSYYIEFSNGLTTVSVWHCCRATGDGCGEIVSSSSFSTTPVATPTASPTPLPTPGPPPTPSATPSASPSPAATPIPPRCSSFAGMAFLVTATAAGLQVVPSNQNPGDIGLCAENSPLSDRAVTMFYRTAIRRQLGGAQSPADLAPAHALVDATVARALQPGFLRCETSSGNPNIGPFDLPAGSTCVDGPPWCSSEVGLSYAVEFASPGLTSVSVFHCCRASGSNCGEIFSSESFSTTPMATPSQSPPPPPPPTPSGTPNAVTATPSPTLSAPTPSTTASASSTPLTSGGASPSNTASVSLSPTATPSPSLPPATASDTPTGTGSGTATLSMGASASVSPTCSPSASATAAGTPPPGSASPTPSASPSRTPSTCSTPGGAGPSGPPPQPGAAAPASASLSPGGIAGASIGGLLAAAALLACAAQIFFNVQKSKAAQLSQGSSAAAQQHSVAVTNPLGGVEMASVAGRAGARRNVGAPV